MAGISLRWLNRGVALHTPHHHSVVILARVRCGTSDLPSEVGQAMAPKTTPKKKQEKLAASGLSPPVVSASDIAKAKEALLDEKAKKRENSNLRFWLKKTGNKEAYDASPMHARKDLLLQWFADKMNKVDAKSTGWKDIGTSKTSGHEYGWFSKHQLVQTLGKEKAEARIASGKMATRPDSLTGLSDEWSLEYKSFSDVGSEMESEVQNHRIETELAVKNEAAKAELLEDWNAARLRDDGDTGSSSSVVYIKKEPSEEQTKEEKQKAETQKKLAKTMETLTNDPRKILKVLGETLISLKVMFQSTLEGKYTEKLNEDIAKLLPRFKTDFKCVESLAMKSSQDLEKFAGAVDGEAFIRAIAVKLENNFEQYNELCDWHSKFAPNNSRKHKKQ